MTRFDLAADLDCSAEQAWRLLTDPAVKNEWSTGLTIARDTGGDGRFDRPGATREVKVGLPTRPWVSEVVTHAEEPTQFAYRIYKSSPLLREYTCHVEIEPTAVGCAVRYTVNVDFAPTVGPLVEPRLRRSIERSLEGLSARSKLVQSTPQPLPYRRRRRPSAGGVVALRPELQRYLGHQQLLAEELARDADPKYWFARLCALTTEELLRAIDAGRFSEPEWMLRLACVLHRRHVSTLHAYRSGGAVARSWREAWGTCEENPNPRSFRDVAAGITAACQAHMAEDMPRALAEAYLAVADEGRDYREFRSDYLDVAKVYTTAIDRLCAEMPARVVPRVLRLSGRVLPELRDVLTRHVYDVEGDRLRAFDRGFALACDPADAAHL
ncbi:DUF5995 family protein [Williamsia deligens]|uniref:DUF5995 family protein n=1 Tax=Williamsia deligens TaxID=321325 RepID=A0ABW3GD29_9NOCA|nr:DUF5995 family protein [Williamsia deligens]MCP2192430.1 Polyketide cyclase / dehydrase and lipid transport [Williamsia deligens]